MYLAKVYATDLAIKKSFEAFSLLCFCIAANLQK